MHGVIDAGSLDGGGHGIDLPVARRASLVAGGWTSGVELLHRRRQVVAALAVAQSVQAHGVNGIGGP